MAYLKAAEIATRLREVIEFSLGSTRVVPVDRIDGDLPDGLSVTEEMRRAIESPRINVSITNVRRSEASPPVTGDLLIYELDVELRIVRTVTPLEQLSDTDRIVLEAAQATDSDVIRQALEFPGNLSTTAAGDNTGLVSGMLSFVDASTSVSGSVDDGAQKLETVHRYTAFAIARPAVAAIAPASYSAPVIS